ncbi:MAG: HlyD family efflux transporter periplasmic adaptor subunit [Rubrivivax sp.]|nr:HlyD family efflux transporter periplasmic adaptor subunit [Rubrivivax sp.]
MKHSPPELEDDSQLFRRQAMEEQRAPAYGQIVLLPGGWSRWMAIAALALSVAAVLLIVQGSYTRRSTVPGQLMPSEGLIRVTSSQGGIVIERRVQDGQEVRKGDTLFVLSDDRAGPDDASYQREIGRQIEARRQSLEDDLRRIEIAKDQESAQLRRRADSLTGERVQIARQGELLRSRVKGAQDAVERYQQLFRQGFVSRDNLLAREGELIEARARQQGQIREAMALERDLVATQRDIDNLETRFATQRAELQRAVLLARQEFTELEARRRIVVAAPADGRVTLMQTDVGQRVEALRPVVHLVPLSASLVAQLYVPSRSAGFVKPGTPVQVRYDAYPYQKFGQHRGKVVAVSAAAVSAADLPPQLALQPAPGETLFAVTVALPGQTMGPAGRPLPLQVGMRVQADLLHETRRLYEWILEPLYATRARMDGGS